MPKLARRCAGRPMRSTWPSNARPLAGSAPMMARSSVVLPAPLRPIRPHICPSVTNRDALRMIGTMPIDTLRFATSSMGGSRGLHLHAGDELLHLRVAERLFRRSVGDHRAFIEGKHAVGEAADDLHVVLDKQHGDLARLERRHDHL